MSWIYSQSSAPLLWPALAAAANLCLSPLWAAPPPHKPDLHSQITATYPLPNLSTTLVPHPKPPACSNPNPTCPSEQTRGGESSGGSRKERLWVELASAQGPLSPSWVLFAGLLRMPPSPGSCCDFTSVFSNIQPTLPVGGWVQENGHLFTHGPVVSQDSGARLWMVACCKGVPQGTVLAPLLFTNLLQVH